MSIPSSFIDQLIDQSDIVEVVGRRLQLNKKGSNFWCLCPFHDDSNPSMAVNQDKQFFTASFARSLAMPSIFLGNMRI